MVSSKSNSVIAEACFFAEQFTIMYQSFTYWTHICNQRFLFTKAEKADFIT